MSTPSKKYSHAILLLSCLFTIKALYLGFYITPLWDIPDETAHFAYARDLAEGREIPRLGVAQIGSDIMSHMQKVEKALPFWNFAAQHPPIYYFLAAIPLKIGTLFTEDPEILFRLPRIVAAVSGGLLLLVLYRTVRTLGLDDYKATMLAASVGFIPMVSHLSSGTNHDMTLFLFCAFAALFFARFILFRNVTDAYWSAFWLTLAGGTKMTAWVIIPPILFFIALEMPGPRRFWLKHMIGIASLALLLPVMWMGRNMFFFSNLFYTSHNKLALFRLQTPLNDTFFEYIHQHPVFEHYFNNFYGLLGWIGTGKGKLNWFQVYGAPYYFFSFTMLAITVMVFCYIILRIHRHFKQNTVDVVYPWQNGIFTRCFLSVHVKKCFCFWERILHLDYHL